MNPSEQAGDDLRKIAEGVSAATGEAFFRSLVASLAPSLEVDYAFVVKLKEDNPERGLTIAGYGRGQQLEAFEYDLPGTPCHDVIHQKVCCYPAGVQKQFPLDRYLIELGIESYAGIPLVDAAGSVLGLISAMHSRPLDRPEVAISALRIWAARAAAELARLSADAALRQSEARFRNLFENSPDAIFVEDLEGNVLDVNRAACELHEARRDELIGKHVLELVPPEHRQQAEADLARLIRGELDRIEGHSLTRRGRAVPVSIRVSRIDEAGQPALLLHVRDISDRVQAEQALRESQAILEKAQAVGQVGSWISDPGLQGRLSWSREACRIFGVSPAEFDGRVATFFQLVYPEDLPRVRQASRSALAGERSYDIEHRIVRADGQIRWVLQQADVERDADGRPLRMVGMVQDITERKAAAEAQRASEERFRALVENGFEGINVIDAQGTILYASPANQRMLGYRAEEIVGRDGLRFLHPDDVATAFHLLGRLRSDAQQVFSPVLRLKHKDGTWRWVQFIARNLLDHPGVRGIVVNWRDVTERKLAEEKLAIQQTELLHASRLSTMGQMVATMSHEISQPLAALGNYSAACSKMLEAAPSADPELFRGYVGEIARQSQRAAAIVKRLRAFSTKSTPDQEPCDLHWLLKDSVELVASELRRHGVTVQWDLAEPSPQVSVDRVQFQQVIVNLLTNACEAMLDVEPARRSVTVRSHLAHQAAVIEVIDNGIGLSADVMKSLFQPFFTTKPDGMGLGLSICREIVEAHGGQIEALSSGHSGATFRVRMPLAGG